MKVKLSSKGQIVIPKKIRKALSLEAGTELEVKLVDNQIVPYPIVNKKTTMQTIEALYGMFAELDLLSDLDDARKQENDRFPDYLHARK